MKKLKSFFLTLLLLFALVPAFSQDEPVRTNVLRINDYTDSISSAEERSLHNRTMILVKQYGFDMPVCIKETCDLSITHYADWFYSDNQFGYGPNKSGLLLMVITENEQLYLKGFGSGEEIFTDEQKNALINLIRTMRENGSGWLEIVSSYVDSVAETLSVNGELLAKYADQVVEGKPKRNLPSWYPEDVNAFVDFNDYRASRVIDDAFIFSDEQIAEMKQKIKKIQDEYGIDLVIFTDKSSYGFDHGIYAADFHQFCGYGFGDDFTGSVLMICMEEGNRGWWTAATGKVQEVYTEKVINAIDDNLEPYMVAGNYGEGVLNYIDDIYELYKVPDWYPKNNEEFVPFKAANKSRVVDQVGVFTKKEVQTLTERADEISKKYDTDFLILTMDKTIRGGTVSDYGRDYAKYNGYGVGDNNDACIFVIQKSPDGKLDWGVTSTVSEDQRKCYTEKNFYHLYLNARSKMEKGKCFSAAKKVMRLAGGMYKHGYVLWVYWGIAIGFGILVGLFFAFAKYCFDDSCMSNSQRATEARNYYVEGSLVFTRSEDKKIDSYVTKNRVYSESSSRSYSSSSSSGRSTYRSSYKSSGGRSYSGGGRKF